MNELCVGVMGGITEGRSGTRRILLSGTRCDGGVTLPLRLIGVMGELLLLVAAGVSWGDTALEALV